MSALAHAPVQRHHSPVGRRLPPRRLPDQAFDDDLALVETSPHDLDEDLESLQKIAPRFVIDPVKLYLREIAHAPLLNHQQEIDLAKRIEHAQDAEKQLRDADEKARQGRTLLSDVERQQLERQREDGLIATQTFVRSNLPRAQRDRRERRGSWSLGRRSSAAA